MQGLQILPMLFQPFRLDVGVKMKKALGETKIIFDRKHPVLWMEFERRIILQYR